VNRAAAAASINIKAAVELYRRQQTTFLNSISVMAGENNSK
jgi:hypothetical protein